MSDRGVVAAGHPLTAEAAAIALQEGGNAFDATIAGIFAACVVEPVLISPGGGGFSLVLTDGRASVFDFFVHTPLKKLPLDQLDFTPVTADFGAAQQNFEIGLGAIATPGLVRGMFEMHRTLGRMPMREIVAPAVRYAREGVTLNALQAYIFSIVAPIYRATPESRAIFGSRKGGEGLLGEGEVMVQQELADALEVLSIEGDDLFYRGEMGQALVEQCARGGGSLTPDDLSSYRVQRREPLRLTYRGADVATNPPPSTGGLLIAFALRVLEGLSDLRRTEFGSHRHLELLAMTLEATDDVRIEAHSDAESHCPDARILLDEELLERYRAEVRGRSRAMRGTTHVNVMDALGNVCTTTVSNGEGCGHMIPGTGIMPNNMLGEEDLNPHGLHSWQPNQRMTSMMAPTMLRFRDGRTVATGSGGSKRIRAAITQVLVNLVDHGMSVEEAVASPRLYVDQELLSIEAGFEESQVERLLESYPQHHRWDELNLFFGGAHTVEHGSRGFHGTGDPRRGGVCIVVR